MKNRLLILLLLLIMLSGLNTPLTKGMIDVVPPMLNIGLRFLIAFAAMFLLRPRLFFKETKGADLWRILLISVFMAGGYLLWALALLFTTGPNATFFACTSVISIPFLAKTINGTPYSGKILGGIVLTVAGMFLLVGNGTAIKPNPGDLLALAAAIVFAFQVIFTGKYVHRIDPYLIASYQFLFVGLMGLGLSLASGERLDLAAFGPFELGVLVYAGVLITAALYYVQTLAQQKLSENVIGILYALIPLFAAVFSWMILDERLAPPGIAGGLLMVAGIALAGIFGSEDK